MIPCRRDNNPCLCGGCSARLREIEQRLTELERGLLSARRPPGEPEELSCDGCGLVYGKAYPREPSVMVRADGKARCNDCASGIRPQKE